jgi:trimethylamine--corrinoid protein Co-methyltransferase
MRANYQVNATLQFRTLSDDQIEEIFNSALDVLERVGARIYGEEGIALLSGAGCHVGDGTTAAGSGTAANGPASATVRIPSGVVKNTLNSAPNRVVVAGRDRSKRIYLEKDKIHFGTGSDCPSLVDPYTDEVRPYTYQDVYNAARISDALPHIDFHMSLGLTSGVMPQTYDRHQFLAMLRGTSKPFVITTVDKGGLVDQYRMACEVLGGAEEFAKTPLFVVYIEPSSPLSHSMEAVEKILYAAETGIPAIYTPCTMCGGTAPVTLAGGLVQTVAECLVGVVLAQLKRKGAPVIIGGVQSLMDVSTSILSYGAPELVLLSAAFTDIAKWLGLPMFSTAGCSDAKTLDQQAAVEASMSILIAALSGANLIHDVGYLESGLLGSYDMLVMSNEAISMAKHILNGITVTPETLAVDVIEHVGPGGHYLTQEHTRQHFRQELWLPQLMDRQLRRSWEAGGCTTMAQRVRAQVLNILEHHEPEPIAGDVEARLKDIVSQADQRHTKQ